MDELADTEKEFPDRVYEMQASLVHNVLMFIEVQNKEGMIEFLKDYHPADIADLFEQIKPTQRSALVELWGKEMDEDLGHPLETCHETAEGSEVFERKWSKATVQLDCKAWKGTIKMSDGRLLE